jgi:hypothetical protein
MDSISHWTAFDPVARTAPDALIADGSNFFAYCGYDPVNNTDPAGGWKVPRPIPLPDGGETPSTQHIDMQAKIFTALSPPESSSTQPTETSKDEILPPVPISDEKSTPPQLPDVRESDCSGNGPQDRVVSPGPDYTTKKNAGGGIIFIGLTPSINFAPGAPKPVRTILPYQPAPDIIDTFTSAARNAASFWAKEFTNSNSGTSWKIISAVMGGLAALADEDQLDTTISVLTSSYIFRVFGPFTPKGLPKSIRWMRKYFRFDHPHGHNPQWHLHFPWD